MLSIGAFAQIGQVTHRMLRHWDAAGILVPAQVDESSGYRSYDPAQLERLHRIVALRQLGFGLEVIEVILDHGGDDGCIAVLLRARRAEIEREHRVAAERLIEVDRRLRLIERKETMTPIEIIEKALPAVRLAARRVSVQAQPEVAGVVEPAFDAIAGIIGDAPGALDVPIAEYTLSDDGIDIIVGYAYAGPDADGFDIVELAPHDRAVCGVHIGGMDRIAESWQAVHQRILERGLAPSGPCRELYVRAESADQGDWVTELQQPVGAAG